MTMSQKANHTSLFVCVRACVRVSESDKLHLLKKKEKKEIRKIGRT